MKKFIFFFTCVIIFLYNAVCQPVVTDASNKRILEWDSSYQVEKKYFRSDSFYEDAYQFIIRRNDKTVAEYLRHDDQSLLFVLYDSTGWIIQRGLLKYTDEKYQCEKIEIYDWSRDPNGKFGIRKDTIFCEGSLRKNGIWKETDNYGLIWKGEYKNGLREGEWKEGYLYKVDYHNPTEPRMRDYFRPNISHLFTHGFEVPLYTSVNWQQVIKKDWFFSYYQFQFNKRILQLSSYRSDVKWHFVSNKKIEITSPTDSTRKKMQESISYYKIIDDKLIIYKKEEKQVFQLVKFSDSEITLKILENYIAEEE